LLILNRDVAATEKKRGAEEDAEMPDGKKPRLENDTDAEVPADAALAAADAAVTSETPAPAAAPAPSSKATAKGKGKKGEGGSSFKEHPYTFLPADDPTLVGCMYTSSPPTCPHRLTYHPANA
jgi:multisite-specific tRNA:(cytosine-C5)-methyltransferase